MFFLSKLLDAARKISEETKEISKSKLAKKNQIDAEDERQLLDQAKIQQKAFEINKNERISLIEEFVETMIMLGFPPKRLFSKALVESSELSSSMYDYSLFSKGWPITYPRQVKWNDGGSYWVTGYMIMDDMSLSEWEWVKVTPFSSSLCVQIPSTLKVDFFPIDLLIRHMAETIIQVRGLDYLKHIIDD